MTIWLLAILILIIAAAVGYQQGAIRTSIAFFGILLATLLCPLVGKAFKPLLGLFGVASPILLWVLPTLLGFVAIVALVKVGAFFVHQRVDVYYKYKAGDLRLSLWERLNARLGACVGVLNGVAYVVLIAFVIHAFSYWTVQMASAGTDPKGMRLLNALGRDLQSTGLNRVAKAVDPLKNSFYDTADLAGKLYQNPMLEARLLRYPGFLTLGEKPELQALGQDSGFAELRLTGASLSEALEQPSAKAVFSNPALLKEIWTTVQPDLADLDKFLETGKSEKYDGEKILGRWRFDSNGSMLAYRRLKPKIVGGEATRIRAWMHERFGTAVIVAAPDKMVVIKNFSELSLQPGQAAPSNPRNLKGEWSQADDADYAFNLEGGTEKRVAKFEGKYLVLAGEGISIAFIKED